MQRPDIVQRECRVLPQVLDGLLDVSVVKLNDRDVLLFEVPCVVLLTLAVRFEEIGDRQIKAPRQRRLKHHVSDFEVGEYDRVDDVGDQQRATVALFSRSLGSGRGPP